MRTLKQHQEIVEKILEAMAGVVVVDADNKIVYVNQNYADVLDVDPKEAEGKDVRDVIPGTRMPIIIETGQEEIGSVFVTKKSQTIIVNRLPVKKDGKVIGAVAFTALSKMDDLTTISTMEQVSRLNFEINQYKQELQRLRGAKYSLDQIIGASPLIERVKESIRKVAKTRSTVLITGETGTGKELIAHAIHQEGPRS
ncbi:MAG: sigma 54-interacting transcriptional regulator, partial [Syntrophales bacterium]|nr:sigma 54-interacting transcriptional regulator [Syntrophales bacterium]